MPCVKLTLTNNKFFFLLSQEKAFRTCFFTSTPSKSLSGLLTGSLVGLFVLCHACHSDKDSLWLHSSGDSLSSNCLAEELTEKWKTWEACVCLCAVCVGVRNGRRRCKGLLHSMCWLNVCVCVSMHCLMTSPCLLQYLCCPPTHCAPTKTAALIVFPSAFAMTHTMARCEAALLLTPVKPC